MDPGWSPWKSAARELGGDVEIGARTPLLRADVHGTETRAGVTAAGRPRLTWVAADAPAGRGLRVAISHRRDYPLRGAFAIATSDATFDDRFTVKTNDAPFARVWLDADVRDRIGRTSGYHFVLDDGRASAWCIGEDLDTRRLVDAILAVAALARRGERLVAEWDEVVRALGAGRLCRGGNRPGAMTVAVDTGGVAMNVDGFFGALARRRRGRGLFTRVRCERAGDARDRFALYDRAGRRALRPGLVDFDGIACVARIGCRYTLEAEDVCALGRRLTPAVRRSIGDARPEVIVADRARVTVFFLGFETDPTRVRRGLEIAHALAVAGNPASAGPYR